MGGKDQDKGRVSARLEIDGIPLNATPPQLHQRPPVASGTDDHRVSVDAKATIANESLTKATERICDALKGLVNSQNLAVPKDLDVAIGKGLLLDRISIVRSIEREGGGGGAEWELKLDITNTVKQKSKGSSLRRRVLGVVSCLGNCVCGMLWCSPP
mmetsp:Transcript_39736/g.93315  ORF Transcript_39736/g.93315 Transcript_39736/m.93315 type:complete len:157 (+) Transcript_39736:34-504(+)